MVCKIKFLTPQRGHPQGSAPTGDLLERFAKSFSQEAFANEISLDRTYMGGIERGERNIAAINLIRIAKGLKVEVGDLFPPITDLKID